ncbi:hypothetical protein QYF36_021854 [Acer negundo]|nr:hypothetical protein QYF36_021854 [Acer negundo]
MFKQSRFRCEDAKQSRTLLEKRTANRTDPKPRTPAMKTNRASNVLSEANESGEIQSEEYRCRVLILKLGEYTSELADESMRRALVKCYLKFGWAFS